MLFHFSEPQFTHLSNGYNNRTSLVAVFVASKSDPTYKILTNTWEVLTVCSVKRNLRVQSAKAANLHTGLKHRHTSEVLWVQSQTITIKQISP